MSDRVETVKLLPPPQDYDGTVKRLGLWNGINFDQSVKMIFDNWARTPELVNKDDLANAFKGASSYVNLLPIKIFGQVEIDESPTIRMLRDMARMAVSENNNDNEKMVMVKGLIAFTVATCGEGKEWNDANDWLKENGKDLVSLSNRLLNKSKKKK